MTRTIRIGALAVGITMAFASGAVAQPRPSFDCAKASHEIERLVCRDEGLAALDRKMAEVFAASVKVLQGVADSRPALQRLRTLQSGWVRGRDDCWKESDKRQCAQDAYRNRIVELQATYGLVKGGAPVFYACENNPANEIVATFFETDPPSVRLERGDTQKIGIARPAASGARYEADFGVYFWVKGEEALAEWPEGAKLNCKIRKTG